MTRSNTMTLTRIAHKSAWVATALAALMALTACGEDVPRVEDTKVEKLNDRIVALEAELKAVADAPAPFEEVAAAKPKAEPKAEPKKIERDIDWEKLFEPAAKADTTIPKKVLAPSQLKVVDSAIGTEVVNRVPEGIDDEFSSEDEMLWAWVKVRNTGEEASAITMIWKRDGKTKSHMTLNVGVSKGWRTWSKKSISKKDVGEWTVEVYNPEGDLLEAIDFTIEKPEVVPFELPSDV